MPVFSTCVRVGWLPGGSGQGPLRSATLCVARCADIAVARAVDQEFKLEIKGT